MTYGKDVVIYTTTFEKDKNKTVALSKDKHIQTLLGLDVKLSEMVLLRKPKWQCYKITTRGSEEVRVDIQNLRMQLLFSFPNSNKSTFAAKYKGFVDLETGIDSYTRYLLRVVVVLIS